MCVGTLTDFPLSVMNSHPAAFSYLRSSVSPSLVPFSHPPGAVSPSSTMAPASICYTVGHLPGCSLGPAWFHLLFAPPSVCSSLVFSSTCTSLDFVCCPPPGHPSTSKTSSCIPPLGCHPFSTPFHHPFDISSSRRGCSVTVSVSLDFKFAPFPCLLLRLLI